MLLGYARGMDDEAVRAVAEAMVARVAADIGSADKLADIGLQLAAEHGLDEQETAAAFDQAIARLKLLRLRVMHISDQRQAAEDAEAN